MATDTTGRDFTRTLAETDERLLQLSQRANAFSGSISRAFKDAVVGGRSFEQVLSRLALSISGIALDRALAPLSNLAGGLVEGLFKGFGLGKGATRFARGGVVNGPTLFPMAGGLGLMGEAGAEAILPLARGADGALGVRSQAAAPIVVTMHVTTADAESFRKSEAQVTAMLARAVGRGRRGL